MRRRDCLGMTLLETTLALTIGAVVMASLLTSFSLAGKLWRKGGQSSEAIQHGRVAMTRMSADLRYATQGLDFSSGVLEFETTNMLDSTPDVEVIRYEFTSPKLYRTADGGPMMAVAGSDEEKVTVTAVTLTPKKQSGGGNLVNLGGSDTAADAEAVTVELELQDAHGESYRFSTTAGFRNKG